MKFSHNAPLTRMLKITDCEIWRDFRDLLVQHADLLDEQLEAREDQMPRKTTGI